MLISKHHKLAVGLVPQALNNTNVTGRYFHMGMWRRLLAVLMVGAMAATKTTKIELLQATDAAGTGAKGIPSDAGQVATATVTANVSVTAATLTCATVLAAQAVTINGLTFTAAAAADLPNRKFAVGANDTECAASLVLAINHAAAGVPGVKATSALGVVTLVATDPGETVITIADPAATITPATTEAQAYVELDGAQLDTANGFEYVAAKVTTTANSVVGVGFIRGEGRYSPDQAVGASAIV
jgi:hypothetical protein